MRIGFIIGGFPSLPETFILNQITGLIDQGHSVYIFPKYEKKGISHQEISFYDLHSSAFYPIPFHQNILIRYLKTIPILFRLFVTDKIQVANSLNVFKFGKQALSLRIFYQILPFLGRKIEIIQVHYADYMDRAILLKKSGMKVPVVLMMHGYDLRNLIESNGKTYSDNFKYADKILAISDYSYRTLISYGVPEEKVVIHPVGIDIKKFETINRLPKSSNNIVILSVGRLALIKGHQHGLEAVSQVIKGLTDFKITYRIVGYGPELENLRGKVRELNLQDNVIFTGPKDQDEIITEYRNADIFFHPSLDEITPVVIMEAMASGLPVVATNVGAVSELVHHAESGYLVERIDTKLMATYLKSLIADPELRNKMGSLGRTHVSKRYDIDVLNKRLEEIYLKCLQK